MTDSQCFSFARRDLLCYTDTASMNVNYMQYAGRRICAKFGTNRSTDGRDYEETRKIKRLNRRNFFHKMTIYCNQKMNIYCYCFIINLFKTKT